MPIESRSCVTNCGSCVVLLPYPQCVLSSGPYPDYTDQGHLEPLLLDRILARISDGASQGSVSSLYVESYGAYLRETNTFLNSY